jgi:hypothetical protein
MNAYSRSRSAAGTSGAAVARHRPARCPGTPAPRRSGTAVQRPAGPVPAAGPGSPAKRSRRASLANSGRPVNALPAGLDAGAPAPAKGQPDPHGTWPTRAGGGAGSGAGPRSRAPGCQPRGCAGSGKPGRPSGSRERPVVHRSMHPRMSWQYQRTSGQALPPSATSRLTGRRMPHIQQDSTAVPAAAWTIRSSPAMISPPRGSADREPGRPADGRSHSAPAIGPSSRPGSLTRQRPAHQARPAGRDRTDVVSYPRPPRLPSR